MHVRQLTEFKSVVPFSVLYLYLFVFNFYTKCKLIRLCSVLGVLNVPKFDANVLFVPNCKVLFHLCECIIASLLQVLGNPKNVRARSKISEFSKKSSPPSNGFKYPRLIEGLIRQEQKKIKFLKVTFYVGRPLHGEQNNSLISSVFQTVFLCVFYMNLIYL